MCFCKLKKYNIYYSILLFLSISCQSKNENSISKKQEKYYSHKIFLECGAKDIPLRIRKLTKQELKVSQSGSSEAINLNEKLIIKKLPNNQLINIIKKEDGFFYIETEIDGDEIKGYIIDEFCNKPTITNNDYVSFSEKPNNISDNVAFIKKYKMSSNDLLDYTFCFIGGESSFGQLVSISPINNYIENGNNGVFFKIYVFSIASSFTLEEFAPKRRIYQDSNNVSIGVYDVQSVVFGNKKIEMHIAEDVSFAFFVINPKFDKFSDCVPLDISQTIDGKLPIMLRK